MIKENVTQLVVWFDMPEGGMTCGITFYGVSLDDCHQKAAAVMEEYGFLDYQWHDTLVIPPSQL